MNIIDYFVREKHMQLLAAKEKNMLIAVKSPVAVLVKEDADIKQKDYVKKYILNICNEKEEVIAVFSVSYQFKIQFEAEEKFDDKNFFILICPILYNSISSMIAEFDFPKLSFQLFSNLSIQQDDM